MRLIKGLYKWIESIDTDNPDNSEYRVKITTEKSGRKWYTPQVKYKGRLERWVNIIDGYKEKLINVTGNTTYLNPSRSSSSSESFDDESKAISAICAYKIKLKDE